jgi:hypothetical protein
MMAMSRHAKCSSSRITALPLADIPIEIEWQATPPPEDVLARLLLEMIGEDTLKELFNE